jgi:tRNA threonylcarbamoyladenosine biosynthesis protein TsaE
MNTDTKQVIISTSSKTTEALGAKIGIHLRGGEVIELSSDLGGGKTTFTRGLVKGAGSADHVSSPTFTVSKIYETPNLHIHHFDCYRLDEPGIIAHDIAEVASETNNVLIVEWAGVVHDILPVERLKICFEATGENQRNIEISCPQKLSYLLNGAEE